MERFPIAHGDEQSQARAVAHISDLEIIANEKHAAHRALRDWLAVTWELPKPPAALTEPFALSPDAFAQALRAALPARRRTLCTPSPRFAPSMGFAPVASRLAEAARLENELARLVNRAYGLTQADERLMWETAPPRMPIARPNFTN